MLRAVTQPDAQYEPTPPPPPTPEANDAAQGADQMEKDLLRKRNSVAGSYLGGTTPSAPAPTGKSYLG